MTTKKRGPGRPRMKPEDRLDVNIPIWFTAEERETIREAAVRDKAVSMSAWGRDILLAKAKVQPRALDLMQEFDRLREELARRLRS